MKALFTWRRTLLGLAAAGVIGQCLALSFGAEDAVVIPPPSIDEITQAHSETVVFAGGCFWGVQGVFQHVKGVKKAVSGYAGGAANDEVMSGLAASSGEPLAVPHGGVLLEASPRRAAATRVAAPVAPARRRLNPKAAWPYLIGFTIFAVEVYFIVSF